MMDKQAVSALIQSLDRCINNKCYRDIACPYGEDYGVDRCVDVLMEQVAKALDELYQNKKDLQYIAGHTAAYWLHLCSGNYGFMCKHCPFRDCSEQLLRTALKLLRIARNEMDLKEKQEEN